MSKPKIDKSANTAEYLEKIIALMPGHVYWKDKNGVLLGCNDEQAKSIGLNSRFDVVGLTAYDTLPKEFAHEVTRTDKEVMMAGVPRTVEEILTLPSGEKSIWLSKKVPLFNDEGQVIGILGISFDVTEQRKTEEKLLTTEHKLAGMTIVSASIAHEIRTPLATLDISADTIKESIVPLIEAYQQATAASPNQYELNKATLEGLKTLPDRMKREIHGANSFINMLLMNLTPELEGHLGQIFSMKECVNEALERYPFKSAQRELISWEAKNDFKVKGKQKLIVHILFNLIKNALYYVAHAGKGNIEIKLATEGTYNILTFKDTGAGIPAEMLPHIFNRFFSGARHGSGIGLAYCKSVMEALGGSITCESEEGVYTEFALKFQTIENESKVK